MYKPIVCLISVVILMSLTVKCQAQWRDWDDGDPANHLWSSPANWSPDGLPTMIGDSGNRTRIEAGSGATPILDSTIFDVDPNGAFADRLYVGDGTGNGGVAKILITDGAKLTIGDDLNIAYGNSSHGICEVRGPGTVIEIWDGVKIGRRGEGRLLMNGGTMNVGDSIEIPSGTSTASINIGHLQLNAGIITAAELSMRPVNSGVMGTGTMDVHGGTLILDSNAVPTIQEYIDHGWITAYNGDGTLYRDYDETNQGKTTLTAIHKFHPKPTDGGTLEAGAVELSWTLPDPCVPGQPVSVDVYFTDDYDAIWNFTNPDAMRIVTKQNLTSISVQTNPKKQYYWAVDTYIGDPNDPILGPIFSFFTDNLPPNVDAGADIITWLQDGVRVGDLDATVSDDDPFTVQWTVSSEPNEGTAVIETATAEDTSITLTALGEYVLQLEAFDGEYAGSDTVTIYVYNGMCEAAQSRPDYLPLVGDLNGDCKVDDADMALLQE
ncbi:hypothetical protein ACFL3F_03025, partial [Planctomycetota bacterium]